MISSSFSLFRLETRAVLGRKAAQDVAATIRMLLSNQARVRMVFAAAPSQNEFLSRTARRPFPGFHAHRRLPHG